MRPSLARWVGDADAARHRVQFGLASTQGPQADALTRPDDYYITLVGELFSLMRDQADVGNDWARLGNALAHFGVGDRATLFGSPGVDATEAVLFAAAAFYCGGFPASAHLTARFHVLPDGLTDEEVACFDLLGRPASMRSVLGEELIEALRRGETDRLSAISQDARRRADAALAVGPNEWIPARLLQALLERFVRTNVRAVLPNGFGEFWTPLVTSLIQRYSWEFFPSQIAAFERGLLQRTDTFSLQMPTGAGKTALCETLLYWYANTTVGSAAILLVPYRSLASELRETVVARLTSMGISARCAYGGTVPTGDEVTDLDSTRVMVATPEALSGILSAEPAFFRRIALVICDEGHLLDGEGRGVSLELLLARMRAREGGAPRIVFVSAIVPNIEEINSWLGGTTETVVRSDYRPALAEFAVLRPAGKGAGASVTLDMHPHEPPPTRFAITQFLRAEDFQWLNPATGRANRYKFASVKTQAIAAARKALPMGATAVFAANKRGDRGAVGLAEELLEQTGRTPNLPAPTAFWNQDRVAGAVQYLESEYGSEWVGTRSLRAGAILHHGDIPQETREVLEGLLRRADVRFAICTSTLAEGVNLPIRTLVLYSVQRRGRGGRPEALLARDIKNLVGRAGRAGSTTKGLVICANPGEWSIVAPVARQEPGEPVRGALRELVSLLQRAIVSGSLALTNELLESEPLLHTLVDGVDSTLIDLATEEMGEDALVRLAIELADQTFASRQATLETSRVLLRNVFELRARRVLEVRASGRLAWLKDSGTRVRMLESVESDLLPRRDRWDDVTDPIDPQLVRVMLEWAWTHAELQAAVREAYRRGDEDDLTAVREPFFNLVSAWLSGRPYVELSAAAGLAMDDLLGAHTRVVGFVLQTLVEQAIVILERLLQAREQTISASVSQFPEHLRFGVPTVAARVLAARGVRHRRAAVELGRALRGLVYSEDRQVVFPIVRQIVEADSVEWQQRLGALVLERTLQDLR